MIGESPAVKAQFEALSVGLVGAGVPRKHRVAVLSLVLGMAELVAEEARAQERQACIAIADEMATLYTHSRPCHYIAHQIAERVRARD